MTSNELTKYINFQSENDFENYLKYQKVRSKEIYYFVSKWLKEYSCLDKSKVEKIDYQIVNDWIKYDKSVKDILYIFISTFEEYFKASLLEKVTYQNEKFSIQNVSNKQNANEDIWKILNDWSKFARCETGYYQSILKFFTQKKYKSLLLEINSKFKQKEIIRVNNLRNKVMHFSFLMLPINSHISKSEQLNNYFKKLKNEIETLKNLLPEPWNKYFIDDLNKCAKDSNDNSKKTIAKKLLMEVKS